MTRTRYLVILMPALACALSSCSGTGEGLVAVSGKVVCDGEPAAGAILFFHRVGKEPGPAPPAANVIPSATVGSDGSLFRRERSTWPRGCAWEIQRTGRVARARRLGASSASKTKSANVRGKMVTVAKHDRFDAVPTDRLKGRYSDASKPAFTAEIKSGPTDLGTYEISMK